MALTAIVSFAIIFTGGTIFAAVLAGIGTFGAISLAASRSSKNEFKILKNQMNDYEDKNKLTAEFKELKNKDSATERATKTIDRKYNFVDKLIREKQRDDGDNISRY